MCRKTSRTCRADLLLALALAFGSAPSIGQTIGELAEAQRVKLRADVAQQLPASPAAQAAAAPQATSTAAPALPPPLPEPPKLLLHGLYERAGKWTAEITDGSRLVTPAAGMFYGKWIVEVIDGEGLHLRRMQPCRAKPAKTSKSQCVTARVVRVGEAL